MKKLSVVAFVIVFSALLIGCGDRHDAENVSVSPQSAAESEKESLYSDLGDNDVLISVNGVDFTKKDAESRLALTIALAKATLQMAGDLNDPKIRALFLRRMPGQFTSETLLLHAARQMNIKASDESRRYAEIEIVDSYGDEGMSFEDFVKKIPAKARNSLNELIETSAIIHEYLLSEAGEIAKIDEKEIDDVVELGKKQKEESAKVLLEQREKAQEIYNKLLAGEPFEELAKDSFTADEDDGTGEWGDFTPDALESQYPGILEELSVLAPGQITKPVELEDGIYIVEFVSVEGSDKVSVFAPDLKQFHLRRIVVPLPVLYEVAEREEIRHELLKQRLLAFQKEKLLPELFKKAKIEHPNGKILFLPKKDKNKTK